MIYEKGKLYDLSIIDLKIDTNQPRKSMDLQALEELAASIKTHGIIQPLLFRVADDSPYLLIVAGERRYKAAQQVGLLIVPGLCVRGNEQISSESGAMTADINPSEIALIENMLRQDLTPIEEAEGLQSLMVEQNYSQDQLSAIIGKARQTVNETMLLNRLPQEIRDECRGDRKITRTTLIEISRKKQSRSMMTAYNNYKEQLQKQEEGRKKAEKLSDAARLCQTFDKTREKLATTEIAEWSNDDLLAVNNSGAALQEALQNFLNTPGESNLA